MHQILLFSDLVAPLWMVIIMGYLMDRGFSAWKAWIIASTFCVVQAYVVAKLVGWNIGGYVIIFISAIPSMLSGKPYNPTNDLDYWFWVLPPLVLIVIPALLIYLNSKYRLIVLNDKLRKYRNSVAVLLLFVFFTYVTVLNNLGKATGRYDWDIISSPALSELVILTALFTVAAIIASRILKKR